MNIPSPGSSSFTPDLAQVRHENSGPELRSLAQAAQSANTHQAAGDGREFSIAIDRVSRQVVVRIIDSRTRDIIEQTPADYLLRLRDYYESLQK